MNMSTLLPITDIVGVLSLAVWAIIMIRRHIRRDSTSKPSVIHAAEFGKPYSLSGTRRPRTHIWRA